MASGAADPVVAARARAAAPHDLPVAAGFSVRDATAQTGEFGPERTGASTWPGRAAGS